MLGIDVHAYYQRGLDWGAAKARGVGYAWVKLTDGGNPYSKTVNGITYVPATHVRNARAAGVPVGGYCYAQPGSGAAHADRLINECERLGATTVHPAIDIESDPNIHTWGTQEAIDYGRAYCRRARERGYRPVVYMNDSMAGATNPAGWPEDPVLWIARYGAKPTRTPYDVHQYSSSATYAGSAGLVDENQSYNNTHLNTGGATMPLDSNDKTAIKDIVMDALTGSTGMWYGPRFRGSENYAQVLHQTAADARAAVAGQANLVKLLTDQNEASAEDIAEALLPNVVAAVQAELADVEGADEVAIAQAVTDRIGGLLRPGTGTPE